MEDAKIEKKIIEKENSLEIIVSCEEDSNLEQYINDGWKIKKNTQNKKFVHGKQPCHEGLWFRKDKGCKIVQPDKIGKKEFIY